MWPLERNPVKEYLRLGRFALERWYGPDQALKLIGRQPVRLDEADKTLALGSALRALYSSSAPRSATVLLESTWLPIALLDTGATWLSASELETLARHRFALYDINPQDPVSSWDIRLDRRHGDRFGMAYGMPLIVKQTLLDLQQSLGVRWLSFRPAVDWYAHRQQRKIRRLDGHSWSLYAEQDRTLIVRWFGGRVVGLNPAAQPLNSVSTVDALVEVEAARQGVLSHHEPMVVGAWASFGSDGTSPAARTTWLDFRGEDANEIDPAHQQIQVVTRAAAPS